MGILITVEEHKMLLRRDRLLTALENLGVDNWEGYDDAMREFLDGEDEPKVGTADLEESDQNKPFEGAYKRRG